MTLKYPLSKPVSCSEETVNRYFGVLERYAAVMDGIMTLDQFYGFSEDISKNDAKIIFDSWMDMLRKLANEGS